MNEQRQTYRIKAYTEWEVFVVEAECLGDEHAKEKARRYGSLKHFGGDLPAVIFSHVVAVEPNGNREVGTWEYRLKPRGDHGFVWHEGSWAGRPAPPDKMALRNWRRGS
jgi:hypothetical protein